MKVKDIMNPAVYKIDENKSLGDILKIMKNEGIKRVFVENSNNKIIGVVSYRDLVDLLMTMSMLDLLNTSKNIGSIAKKEILKINQNEDIIEGAKIMVHGDVSALLVVDDNNNPVGVLSQTDLLRSIIKESKDK